MYDLTASDVYQKRKKNSKLPDNGNFATVSCNIRTLLSRNSKLDSAFEERKERNNENSTINSKDIIEHTSKKITRMINISIFPPPYYEKQFPKAKIQYATLGNGVLRGIAKIISIISKISLRADSSRSFKSRVIRCLRDTNGSTILANMEKFGS